MRVVRKLTILSLVLGLAAGTLQAGPTVHHLGPTGLLGTTGKNSIKVTKVEKGSPADGKIKAGDEIIGAGASKFKNDVRRELAAAVDEAETQEAGGKLALTLKGNKKVELQLTVLGRYSSTAPYDCAKSDRIIQRAADYLVEQGKLDSGACKTGLLGLMATGEKQYIEQAAKTIQAASWAKADGKPFEDILRGDRDAGYVTWNWGYILITLGEYYLLTKDESVLPAIRTYAVTLAKGQDQGGLYGHRLATDKRNGRLPGYAQMNQPSLTCFMGMLFAKECGVDDPALDKGIEQTYAYYSTFIGKGAFNYGVHGPNTRTFNNNGTSGSAAVCMALSDNTEGTRFFSQLSATSYDGLEIGHASTFFNPLWTPLGADLSGPEVTQQFFRKSLWLQTMYRSWDGSFSRFGGGSKEGPQTGVALLAYCLPRKALIITGRGADKSLWMKGQEATAVVERSKVDYNSKSVDELLALFGDPIPQVTRAAVWTLRSKESNFIPRLVKMMKEGTRTEKISAIGYFGYKCPPEQATPQIDRLGSILRDKSEDPEVRATAASSLSFAGEPAYKYYADMLRLVVEDEPGDRFRDVDQSLGRSINGLCSTPFESGLVTDKDLFYEASNKLIHHPRQQAREQGLRMLAGIPLEDFSLVANNVMHIIEDKDPTYHSYHAWQGSINAAITVLANLNIAEGIPLTVSMLDREGGKWGFKVRMVAASLPKYGANAGKALKKIQTDPRLKDVEKSKFGGPWNRMVKAIENDETPRKLISLEDAKRAGANP